MSNKSKSIAVPVSQEIYDDFMKYTNNFKDALPTTRSQFLHDVKFAHNYPHLQGWIEKCSILEYGTVYFHGMRVAK